MTNPRRTTLVIYIGIFLSASILHAQTATADPTDLKELVHQVQSLRQELKEIKDLLQTQQTTLPVGATRGAKLAAPVPTEIVLPFVPQQSTGDEHAKYVVVEFADLQCPFCAYFNKNAFPTFETEYVKSGKTFTPSSASTFTGSSVTAGSTVYGWNGPDAGLGSISTGSSINWNCGVASTATFVWPIVTGVFSCSNTGGPNPFYGVCTYSCSGPGPTTEQALALSAIQRACPPTRDTCPYALDARELEILPFGISYALGIIPNSCVYTTLKQ